MPTAKRTKKPPRRLRCRSCRKLGEPGTDTPDQVAPDSRLCENCESEHEYCQVCDTWLSRDSDHPCPHISWVDGKGWGGYGYTGVGEEWYRDDVLLLLDRLPELVAELPAVRKALTKHLFAARCSWRGWDLLYGRCRITVIPEERKDALLADDDLGYALAWVGSLDGPKTKDANAMTVQWIDEWLARRKADGPATP